MLGNLSLGSKSIGGSFAQFIGALPLSEIITVSDNISNFITSTVNDAISINEIFNISTNILLPESINLLEQSHFISFLTIKDLININDIIKKVINVALSDTIIINEFIKKDIVSLFKEQSNLLDYFNIPFSVSPDTILILDSIFTEYWSPKADILIGEYDCDVCGFTYKKSTLLKRWDNALVCKADYEEQHPRDFINHKYNYRSLTNGNI